MQIGIIGLGLMGGSLALALKKHNSNLNINGYDLNQNNLNYCLDNRIIDNLLDLKSLREYDVIFIAVPVKAVVKVITEIYPYLKKDKTIITDLGSTKNYLSQQIRAKFPELLYCGGHPMAGSEKSGPETAFAELFKRKVYILTRSEFNTSLLENLITSTGAELLILDPAEHDYIVALTSHLPQLLSSCLINLLAINKLDYKTEKLIGQGFKDMARLAGSSPAMWNDIFITNKQQVLKHLDCYIDQLSQYRDTIKAENTRGIIEFMENGNNVYDWLIKEGE